MANQRDETTAQDQFFRFLDKRSASSQIAHYSICDSIMEIANHLRQTRISYIGKHRALATRHHVLSTPYHNPSIITESDGERKLRKWKAPRLLGKMKEIDQDHQNRANTLYHISRKAYDEEIYVKHTSEGYEVPEEELRKGYVPVPQPGTTALPLISQDVANKIENVVTILVGLLVMLTVWYLVYLIQVLSA